jgi:hypothetical protein
MSQPESSPQDWFEHAVHCYDEEHQACPWCGGAHRVYRSERNQVIEYYCGSCEFFAGFDSQSKHYVMGPGRHRPAPATMYAI